MAKQVIVLRKDLNMRKGKMAAQAAHASMAAILNIADHKNKKITIPLDDPAVEEWLSGPFKKIVVGCDTEQELLDLHEVVKRSGMPFALIRDAGRTEFGGVPTLTALAVGPGFEDDVDKITGGLTLL